MKIVCINNEVGNSRHCEMYKIYDSKISKIERRVDYYVISLRPFRSLMNPKDRLDQKIDVWVEKKCFVTLEDWRRTKLESLLQENPD